MPLIHMPSIEKALYRLASDMHVISQRDFRGGEEVSVKPFFPCSSDGSRFYAGLKVWPLAHGGNTRARAGTEWGRCNHLSLFYLSSPNARLFNQERVVARVKAILHDELEFTRCRIFQDPSECRARVAFGPPEVRNGIVYCSIRRCTDPVLCVVQIISRILRHLSVFLLDYGYLPLDCELRTVSLHMQWHPGRGHQALWTCFRAWASVLGHQALRKCFRAWVSESRLSLRRRRRAAVEIGTTLEL